jgi:hypothetical protein
MEAFVRPDDVPWLTELHSRIWSREDLKPTLFRQVEVTRAHYDTLQECLNRKYPDRNSKEYDGRSHNVLSDKLDSLKRSTPAEPLSLQHPDDDADSEANNKDDPEVKSLFPFTLRYLDLSSLELKNESDRFPLPLLCRQEYDCISKLINKSPRSGHGSVIVSGQPGTGEVLVSLSRRI